MTAVVIKEIADKVNQEEIDKVDADFDHVEIEILESAKRGEYSLDYHFLPEVPYARINEIKNRLLELGYDVAIIIGANEGMDCFVLEIDWSKNH